MWPQNTLMANFEVGVSDLYISYLIWESLSQNNSKIFFKNLEQIKNNPSSFSSKNQKQQASNKDYWFLYNKSVADKLTFIFVLVATLWSWGGRKGDEMNVTIKDRPPECQSGVCRQLRKILQ